MCIMCLCRSVCRCVCASVYIMCNMYGWLDWLAWLVGYGIPLYHLWMFVIFRRPIHILNRKVDCISNVHSCNLLHFVQMCSRATITATTAHNSADTDMLWYGWTAHNSKRCEIESLSLKIDHHVMAYIFWHLRLYVCVSVCTVHTVIWPLIWNGMEWYISLTLLFVGWRSEKQLSEKGIHISRSKRKKRIKNIDDCENRNIMQWMCDWIKHT